MQRVERGQAETIRRFEKVEELAHHLRRLRVLGVPRLGEYEIVGADQLEAAVRHRLIDNDLRTGRFQDTALHQLAVDVVKAHAPESAPLTQPNWRTYPSAIATWTSLKRSVESRTILRNALALLDGSRFIASICEWSSCAREWEAPAPSMARASIECRIPVVKRVTVGVFIVFLLLRIVNFVFDRAECAFSSSLPLTGMPVVSYSENAIRVFSMSPSAAVA